MGFIKERTCTSMDITRHKGTDGKNLWYLSKPDMLDNDMQQMKCELNLISMSPP